MALSGREMVARERADAYEGGLDSEDDKYVNGELAFAAVSYVLRGRGTQPIPMYWPWPDQKWNPSPHDHRIDLAKAGALIEAEIDRLNRKEEKRHAEDMASHRPPGPGDYGGARPGEGP